MFVKKFKPSKLILASDSKNYWRKDIFPEYKAHRAKEREKSKIDYTKFFKEYGTFIKELKEVLPNTHFIEVERCEADDIIAVLCTEKYKNDTFINISTDSDFHQLLQYKNYVQFDPQKRRKIKHINPKQGLNIKILSGDRKDNIPPIRPRIGKVTATGLLSEGLDELLRDSTLKSSYDRNKQLIDLSMIPQEYKTKIMKEFNTFENKKFNSGALWQFLLKHKLDYLVKNVSTFARNFKEIS